jgi:hypothetical protein
MPEIEHLEKFLESLKLDRVRIDGEILQLEQILVKYPRNGTPPIADATPGASVHAPASKAASSSAEDRQPFSVRYPGVSLEGLLLRALSDYGPSDRQELQALVKKEGYEFAAKSYDVVLRRLEVKKKVRKVPKPSHKRRGKFKNMWDLVPQPVEEI